MDRVVTVHPTEPPCQDPDVEPQRSRQPWLHELQVAVRGPVTSLSLGDGDVDARRPGAGATGVFCDDRRVLNRLVLRAGGAPPTGVLAVSLGAVTETLAVARTIGDPGPDPTVEVARRRELGDRGLRERVTVRNRSADVVRCHLEVEVAGDGAELPDVKYGVAPAEVLAVTVRDGVATWADARHVVRVSGPGASISAGPEGALLEWHLEVPPAGSREVEVVVDVERATASAFDADAGVEALDLHRVRVRATDTRLERTVESSMTDLGNLTLRDPLAPDDVFAAAGTPWYLTLFGRDAIWAARLALPFGTDLARGTLRALARRQGTVDDPATAEAPGKILHEMRRAPLHSPAGLALPTTYFGTVDATPLWVCLLHDAWTWGMSPAVVTELAEPLRAALGWMRRAADDAPDGFLRYVDESGSGLANQGWKDSGDSMRDAAGRVAEAPIALVETQAYAVEAARAGARLLEEVLGEDAGTWRTWADDLAQRVEASFWTEVDGRRILAMALDGAGRPVDGLASNIGHVLGYRHPRAGGGGAGGGRPRRSRPPRAARDLDARPEQPGLQPDRVPHRVGVDARHRDLRAGTGPHRSPRRSRGAGPGARRRRGRHRLPLARALRGRPGARAPGAVPRELSPAGVGGRERRRPRDDAPRGATGRPGRHARALTAAAGALRCAARRGDAARRRRVRGLARHRGRGRRGRCASAVSRCGSGELARRSAGHWWMPHSVLPVPAHRPERGSAPASTRAVHGAQPIDGYSCERRRFTGRR